MVAVTSSKHTLFLVGMMGAGKSTVGRHLAKLLNMSFIDADREIEVRTGAKIPLIFELEGEAGFRRREADLIKELADVPNLVLATGGGSVQDPQTRAILRSHGYTIYLRASIRDIWQRVRHDQQRPLLRTERPRERLEQLLEQRDPWYMEVADLIVETGQPSVTSLCTEIIEQLAADPRWSNASAEVPRKSHLS